MPTKKERLDALEAYTERMFGNHGALIRERGEAIEQLTTIVTRQADSLNRAVDMRVRMQKVIDEQAQRHDTAMDILAERHAEVVARLDKLEAKLSGPFWEPEAKLGRAFPTGAATTFEEVVTAMAPLAGDGPPRRGDRVRLESARSIGGHRLPNRWYEVLGRSDSDEFQIRETDEGSIVGLHLYWVNDTEPGLKEIRRAAPSPQRPAVEPVDEQDLDV